MSAYFKAWNALLGTAKDPDAYQVEPKPVVAHLDSGKPVQQGRETGIVIWDRMSLAEYHDLYNVWNTNKDSSGTFVIPPITGDSWASWRSVTAFAEQPTIEYRGNICQNVSMRLVITA